MDVIWDVIIVGGGPAGLTAGIYTSRHGLKTLLLEGRKIGGRALDAHWIENFPGFPQGLTGPQLMDQFTSQAKKFGVQFKEETVIGINNLDEVHKMVSTRSGFYQTKSVIIASGVQRKQLTIPGETEFKGRGVSYCAICDGPFFKDKKVAVVGSGNEAFSESLHLADMASKVFLIPGRRGHSLNSEEHLESIKRHNNIEMVEGVDILEICGEESVTSIKLKGGHLEKLDVDGIFILYEHVSTSDIIQDTGVTIDGSGCIMVDNRQQTNIPGIFAAGDCCCAGMQVVTAAGDGGKAALSALRYVKSLKN
ncbi:FAD-binding protein [Candidatus Bathyarchaeota archaeon]|nr:FAD-binding protein [Candidatus Bathyarchaeota archaeon]